MGKRYHCHNRRKYSLKAPIGMVTKYQKQILINRIAADVNYKILNICKFQNWDIIAMETDKEHIHFLISYDTTDRVCDIIKIMKQETTYYL